MSREYIAVYTIVAASAVVVVLRVGGSVNIAIYLTEGGIFQIVATAFVGQ